MADYWELEDTHDGANDDLPRQPLPPGTWRAVVVALVIELSFTVIAMAVWVWSVT